MSTRITLSLVVALATLVLAVNPAAAAVRYVAANGVDDPSICGPLGRPCRTIGGALVAAAPGDRIVVGPGLYGPFVLDRPVTLESTAGAGATVVEGELSSQDATIAIAGAGEGAVIGRPSKGFTIRGAQFGVLVEAAAVAIQDSIVSGVQRAVLATGAASNLALTGNLLSPSVIADGAGTSIVQNVIHSGTIGVDLGGPGSVVRDNVITGHSLNGVAISAVPAEIRRNTFTNNAIAIDVKLIGVSAGVVVTSNNFLGHTTCAITNRTAGELVATGNYWGAATGPGPDPADQPCSGAVVRTAPFLRAPMPVTATAGR
jgi:nitrous oxidase accessory protein NosD